MGLFEGFPPPPEKHLERPSSTRLEALVPSRYSRARTRSPSPRVSPFRAEQGTSLETPSRARVHTEETRRERDTSTPMFIAALFKRLTGADQAADLEKKKIFKVAEIRNLDTPEKELFSSISNLAT